MRAIRAFCSWPHTPFGGATGLGGRRPGFGVDVRSKSIIITRSVRGFTCALSWRTSLCIEYGHCSNLPTLTDRLAILQVVDLQADGFSGSQRQFPRIGRNVASNFLPIFSIEINGIEFDRVRPVMIQSFEMRRPTFSEKGASPVVDEPYSSLVHPVESS